MHLNDAVTGTLLLVFGLVLGVWAQTFPDIPGQEYGAGVFPGVIAAGFAGCGLLLVLSGLRSGRPLVAWADWARERHGLRNVFVVIAAVVFYIVAAETLGFMLTMGPILLVLLRLFGVGWVTGATVAILATLLIQYAFGNWLYVPLPWGLLQPVRWW